MNVLADEFYDYFIEEQEIESKNMVDVDDDDFHDKLQDCLENYVFQEMNIYDVEHHVKEFGVLEALQLKLDYEGEHSVPFLDKQNQEIAQKILYRHLLYVILREIVLDEQDGYYTIYNKCKMNEQDVEDEMNEKIDYINNISQEIICF